jgi:hypothetical protein
MQRQECALHPNECNGGNLPGSLSHTPLVKKERERCLGWELKGNNREMKVRKVMDPQPNTTTHDAPLSFRTSKTLSEALDALFFVTIAKSTFTLPSSTIEFVVRAGKGKLR